MAGVAIILPPSERFAPGACGAIGLMVHRLASWPGSSFIREVLGSAPGPVFGDVAYRQVAPAWRAMRPSERYALGITRLLRRTPPELIEVHNRPELAQALAAGLPDSRVCLVLHNDPQTMRGAGDVRGRGQLLARLAGVLTVSGYLRQRLLEGLPADLSDRAQVLPNCLDLSALPARSEWRDPLVLFAGRLVADKGADLFVEAWAQAAPPGWRAEMIGADRFGADSPQTEFLRTLRPRAERAGIVLHGYRPHRDVLTAMARAAIVVVPSRWPEPFGLTALEAMASGAALIYARQGALPEVVGDAGLAFDPGTLAQAMRQLTQDAARREAYGRAGLARARSFDLPEAGARLDAWRHEILGRKRVLF